MKVLHHAALFEAQCLRRHDGLQMAVIFGVIASVMLISLHRPKVRCADKVIVESVAVLAHTKSTPLAAHCGGGGPPEVGGVCTSKYSMLALVAFGAITIG